MSGTNNYILRRVKYIDILSYILVLMSTFTSPTTAADDSKYYKLSICILNLMNFI